MKKKKWRKTSKMIMMLTMTSKQKWHKIRKTVDDASHVANFHIAS